VTITLPGQYAKFLTAVAGEAIAYMQVYGTTWHLQAALVMAGAALAVLGVPNAAPHPPVPPTAAPPPPSTGPLPGPPAPGVHITPPAT
jgi:hypothetical protein